MVCVCVKRRDPSTLDIITESTCLAKIYIHTYNGSSRNKREKPQKKTWNFYNFLLNFVICNRKLLFNNWKIFLPKQFVNYFRSQWSSSRNIKQKHVFEIISRAPKIGDWWWGLALVKITQYVCMIILFSSHLSILYTFIYKALSSSISNKALLLLHLSINFSTFHRFFFFSFLFFYFNKIFTTNLLSLWVSYLASSKLSNTNSLSIELLS